MSGGFYTRAEIREAMDKQVGQRLPGRPEQSPFELSDLQNYIIGSKRKWGDWTLRYSKSAEALACLARLLINTNIAPGATGHVNEDGFEGNLKTVAAIGYFGKQRAPAGLYAHSLAGAVGVPKRVGKRLLHDAIERDLD